MVGRHLVMVQRLLPDDPELAYRHARAAEHKASRVAIVREVTGLAAYYAGQFAEALAELRTARRMTGSPDALPIMADCERGLGRPERALALAASADVASLDKAGQVEMLIVSAGARRDLGQDEAAVVSLQVPDLKARAHEPWVARLRYAYADALESIGRVEEARDWFGRAARADVDGSTDAIDRLADLDGTVFVDVDEEDGPVPENVESAQATEGEAAAAGAARPAHVERTDGGGTDGGGTDGVV